MQEGRPRRVGEQVKKEIAALLAKGVKDPRVGFVSVMDVRMSPDLRVASVSISTFGTDAEKKSSLIGLQQASGWVRREIGKRLRLRHTPEIRFFSDDTVDQAFRLEEIFKEIHEEDGGEQVEE
ncbi:MAG: 30S ribosome-binding factor RbfA [bacterium]|nr:30S ribosome-binding factor RbfA [bacterium]